MSEKEIHIWDISGWENFIVKIDDNFRKCVFTKAQETLGNYTNVLKFYCESCGNLNLRYVNGGKFFRNLRRGGYIRLGPLLRMATLTGFTKSEVEAQIVAYKCGNSGEEVTKPKLPLKRNPVFAAILVHHIFDGSVSGGDRGTYRQANLIAAKSLREKVEFLIGEVKRRSVDPNSFYIPRFLARSFRKEYGCRFFDTYSARIPDAILNGSRDSKMAVLAAAIVDEGTVDNTSAEIYLANENLMNDVRNIALSLGYACSEIRKYKNRQLFCFKIRPLEKLHSDMLTLTRKYPPLDLAHQQVLLEFHVRRRKRQWWKRGSSATKKMIIEKLKVCPTTSKKMMLELGVTSDRINRHLKTLEAAGLVEKCGKAGNSFIWRLSKHTLISRDLDALIDEITKVSYRQRRERSIKRILEALNQGLDDTGLISRKLGLHISTVQEYLKELAKKGVVSKTGRKRRGLAHPDIWKINKLDDAVFSPLEGAGHSLFVVHPTPPK